MLSKIKNFSILYIILSFLCAVCLWLYVDTVEQPNIRISLYDIPVSFTDEDELNKQNLMLDDTSDITINLTISGVRSVVSQITRDNISVSVDLSKQVTEAGVQKVKYDIVYPSNVSASNIKLINDSGTVTIDVVEIKNKTIKIEGIFSGSVAESYVLKNSDNFIMDSDEVSISGRGDIIDNIDHAFVELSAENLSNTWKGNLPLHYVNSDGEEIDTSTFTSSRESVYVEFPINYTKTLSLDVSFKEGAGVTKEDVDYTITPASIKVSGSEDALKNLDVINIGTVDLKDIITSSEKTFEIKVPDGIEIIDDTKTAIVDTKINGNLVTKKYTIKNFKFINVEDNVQAEVISDSVEVRIRGNAESMALLSQNDIIGEIDLYNIPSGYVGTVTLPVDIKITGMSDVGTIDSVKVKVDIDYY